MYCPKRWYVCHISSSFVHFQVPIHLWYHDYIMSTFYTHWQTDRNVNWSKGNAAHCCLGLLSIARGVERIHPQYIDGMIYRPSETSLYPFWSGLSEHGYPFFRISVHLSFSDRKLITYTIASSFKVSSSFRHFNEFTALHLSNLLQYLSIRLNYS